MTTRKIKRNAVTNAKIKDGAVEGAKIADGAVDFGKIATGTNVIATASGGPVAADGATTCHDPAHRNDQLHAPAGRGRLSSASRCGGTISADDRG